MSVNVRVIEGGIGEITQGYKGTAHNGIDIVNKGYTLGNIVAHSDGTVVEYRNNCNGFENGSYGNYVKIKHDNGYYTLYGHGAYNTVKVKTGQRVNKGQVLFYMGNTGYSFGGHVHFEVRNTNDMRIDPTPYINADLPNSNQINVIYQTHDKVAHKYWPNVTNYNTTNSDGYAGVLGHAVDGLRVKLSNGAKVTYQVHLKGDNWLPTVTKWDNTDDGYAGIYNKEIDGIAMKAEGCTLKYRVHLINGGWLSWVSKMDINDPNYGMAGIYGKTIDAVQIQTI